jgi:dual specificity tyrosine-phosphorylation-regulated kinase 2/3/4
MKQAGNDSLNDTERELKFPMDPRTAVINYSKYLMDIEKTEILDYDVIYWFNINERKAQKCAPMTPDGVDNNGFDNDKNEYITSEGNHIAYRFEIVGRLGKGSFGQVFRCYDHKLQEYSGLKILRNKKRLYK